MKHSHSIAALIVTLTLGAAAVHAQTTSPSTAAPADATTAPTSTKIDDKKLDQFADAYLRVQSLQKEAAAQQSAPTDSNAAQQKQNELQTKMMDAVQQSGLQVNEFNEIAQAMVTDVDLRQRVIAKVQQRANAGGG